MTLREELVALREELPKGTMGSGSTVAKINAILFRHPKDRERKLMEALKGLLYRCDERWPNEISTDLSTEMEHSRALLAKLGGGA